MSDPIQDAINLAAKAAAETPQTENAAVVTQTQAPVPAMGGSMRSLESFLQTAALNVEAYLGVNEYGIKIGKEKETFETLEVIVKLSDAKFGYSYRFNGPAGPTYLTSWDGATEARSQLNWASACADAKKTDPSSYGSDLIELPVKLAKDVKFKSGNVLKEGSVVGLSLNYQNTKPAGPFLAEALPRFGKEKEFRVKLGFKPKKSGTIDYAVFSYEILGEA